MGIKPTWACPGFGYIEAECLHGFLRHHKPRRIIEIGSGVSTYCALHAADMNAREGSPATITCVEPYPSDFIRTVKGIDLVERRAEQLDPAFFDQLEAGDFLFIDSTHAVKPKGDVEFIYLELIPRLKPGVLIHIHDIHLPFTHQRDLLTTRFQWAETILLTALLTGNQNLSVLFCLSLLHYDEPEGLREVFPEYRREPGEDGLDVRERELHYPSSIYLETR